MGRMIEIDRREAEMLHDLLVTAKPLIPEYLELANHIGEKFGMKPIEFTTYTEH